MENNQLRYDEWIEEALRRVIRRALTLAAEHGLRGDHHFYITFKTNIEGVNIPAYIRVEHPDEMTIVLQHQFENLIVEANGFSVTLRFKGKPEKLDIPYSAITSFADPSVNFGLQLKTSMIEEGDNVSIDGSVERNIQNATLEQSIYNSKDVPESNKTPKTGEVITLDAFRKKRP